ncbi:HIT family protein [Streptomyces minutiscleroticus]|uniref:HIT domain-containing protein n=1 Tax=Streptomyces minutiscleroticus TaxID=68238 RepID=A0A918U612_9ACTN|nr:hypothetical protein [Streptomyces minutiscleroticus]GGX97247.1 hypothetical protein GCM10010358_58830 [Streptomyces minutiscleroticus]
MPEDTTGCVVCDMLQGRAALPGGTAHETSHWVVMHVLGAFNLGSLAIVPRRHVLHVADLDDDETARLGPLLRDVAAAVTALTDPVRVYTCLWSHTGGEPAHIHFVLQPIHRSDMADHPGRLGPALQAAMLESGDKPAVEAVEEFVARARQVLTTAGS